MLAGLVIREPWITKILDDSKRWEIRSTRTKKNGRVALIASGTGTVVGVADLVGVVGPLTLADFVANARDPILTDLSASGVYCLQSMRAEAHSFRCATAAFMPRSSIRARTFAGRSSVSRL
jgi:hypothetical protein